MPRLCNWRLWLPYLAALLMAFLCVQLGFWQLHRASEKSSLQARYAASQSYVDVSLASQLNDAQRVRLRGTWWPEQRVLLDNRVHHKIGGFDVLMPLRLAQGGVVIINRGWVAGTGNRQRLPQIETPAGVVTVEGLSLIPSQGFSLGESLAEPGVWQRADMQRFAQVLAASVPKTWVLQENEAPDGLLREWPLPVFGIEKHYGYAVQWFAFALLSIGLALYFGWKKWATRRPEVI